MTEYTRIGYLVPTGEGLVVYCDDCAEDTRTPLFDVNVRGYRQSCRECGRLLAGHNYPLNIPELFNGKARSESAPLVAPISVETGTKVTALYDLARELRRQ